MRIWRADLREISSWDLSMRMVNSWWMVLPKRAQVSLQKKSWDECAGTCNIPALSTVSDFPSGSCWRHSGDKEFGLCCHSWWDFLSAWWHVWSWQALAPWLSHQALTTVISLIFPQPSLPVASQTTIVSEPCHQGFCSPGTRSPSFPPAAPVYPWVQICLFLSLFRLALVPHLFALFPWMPRTWFL